METATVWAARLGSPDDGVKGSLILDPIELAFIADRGDVEIRIPLPQIRRVRRVLGSPVMVVEHDTTVVAFYFAQPPPLDRSSSIIERRRDRSTSLTYLGDTNSALRRDIKRWVGRIRAAAKQARR